MATKRGTEAPAEAADQEFDPKPEWQENATNFTLRLNLSGFKKEDFRVQVDGTGRLTVRGQRPAGADGKFVRLHKVFQLPSTANLEEISGRFEANVLTLTVPKRPATAPTTIAEIKKPKEEQQDTKPPMPKEKESLKKAPDDKQKEEEEAKRRKQEKEQSPTPGVRKEEVMKPKAEAAARPTEEAFDRESLAEMARRRGEEERAKAVAAAEEAEREKTTVCGRWKERVVGELEEFADLKWADGLVEAARKNKEVIAAAIAAFSLGFFVSKLLSRK